MRIIKPKGAGTWIAWESGECMDIEDWEKLEGKENIDMIHSIVLPGFVFSIEVEDA